jgi:hypothetical protein
LIPAEVRSKMKHDRKCNGDLSDGMLKYCDDCVHCCCCSVYDANEWKVLIAEGGASGHHT